MLTVRQAGVVPGPDGYLILLKFSVWSCWLDRCWWRPPGRHRPPATSSLEGCFLSSLKLKWKHRAEVLCQSSELILLLLTFAARGLRGTDGAQWPGSLSLPPAGSGAPDSPGHSPDTLILLGSHRDLLLLIPQHQDHHFRPVSSPLKFLLCEEVIKTLQIYQRPYRSKPGILNL